jgi:hypothetical protein
VISAMEACDGYPPWHDKPTHRTFPRQDRKSAFITTSTLWMPSSGLVYLRVPT